MNRACPVVLRAGPAVLVFRHPLAGLHLVTGGIAPGEDPARAAERELVEAAGLTPHAVRDPGQSKTIAESVTWHFRRMRTAPLPDTRRHRTRDDGGHDFAFFRQDPLARRSPDVAPMFHRVRAHSARSIA